MRMVHPITRTVVDVPDARAETLADRGYEFDDDESDGNESDDDKSDDE